MLNMPLGILEPSGLPQVFFKSGTGLFVAYLASRTGVLPVSAWICDILKKCDFSVEAKDERKWDIFLHQCLLTWPFAAVILKGEKL